MNFQFFEIKTLCRRKCVCCVLHCWIYSSPCDLYKKTLPALVLRLSSHLTNWAIKAGLGWTICLIFFTASNVSYNLYLYTQEPPLKDPKKKGMYILIKVALVDIPCPNVSTTPIMASGCRQCYLSVLSSWKVNIAENPIVVMGVEMFGP